MIVVMVHIHVKTADVPAFIEASLDNCRNSVHEPGIARFDFIQQSDDPNRFILVEVYRSAEAQAAHKQTAHYDRWRLAVADMMAEPRQGIKHVAIFPGEGGW